MILAGDHGVSPRGRLRLSPGGDRGHGAGLRGGRAGANCLARQHGVSLRVLDLGVRRRPGDLPAEISKYHITCAQPIHREDALTAAECAQALRAGRAIAETEIAAGADLLILGDMGIGNTTPAAALIAATFGLAADEVVGRGTGIDDERLAHKTWVVATALARMGDRAADPMARLAGLGSADLAAGVGFLLRGRGPRRAGAARRDRLGGRGRRSPRNSIPASSAGARPGTARPSRRSSWRWTSSG